MIEPNDPLTNELREKIFRIQDPGDFNALCLDLFQLHAAQNPTYRGFLAALGHEGSSLSNVEQIPFLPIGLFRNHRVMLNGLDGGLTFTSSGTTDSRPSKHVVPWPELYERSFLGSFRRVYGDPKELRILALLPSYLERGGSSLVHMTQRLIELSGDPKSGTYLNRYKDLAEVLHGSEKEGCRTLLLGVSFALLDLAEQYPMRLRHTTVIETGGMKGRRTEIVREELHRILKKAFGVQAVHSEYGMTELLSQAWSTGEGIFRCPPWMHVRIRDVNDPFCAVPDGRSGGIDVIDLANLASCPFIATQDLGIRHEDGSFEVLGRFDHSDLRGCNLLMEV